jgi:hypothetical protein
MKGLRPYREISEVIKSANLTIWDKKLSKEADPKVLDLILDLLPYTRTDEEFHAAIDVLRFADFVDDYLSDNKDPEASFEFYRQHKNLLDGDKNKAIVFYKKFNIKFPTNFKLDFKEKYHYPDIFYSERLREEIIQEQEYKCRLCEKSLKGIWPHLHHIDYNKRNCDKKNLTFLCPRCHAKTNYNRHFWQTLLEEKRTEN